MKIYGELAPWFHLLTAPADYAEEAAIYSGLITANAPGHVTTLLELGSGGGNNASHYKRRFVPTLVDLSPEMLRLSASINPELEHIQGDMRSVRLGRTFDAVFIHDAISYMVTTADLAAAIATARAHLGHGGVVLLVPDHVLETFEPGTDHGGHDDGVSGLRYLEWTHPLQPGTGTYTVDYLVAVVEGDAPPRVSHDRHTCGVFPTATWLRLLDESGFDARAVPIEGSDWSAVAFVGVARPG